MTANLSYTKLCVAVNSNNGPLYVKIWQFHYFNICTMNQQMHNWSTIYYTALYYTAPTCFDAIAPTSGSLHTRIYKTSKLHKERESLWNLTFT